jgi:phytol kinase
MEMLIAGAVVFALLVTSEILWRARLVRDEFARKFVHISVGTFVAFWPYFMTWQQIELMCLAFLVTILTVGYLMRYLPKYLHIFHAIHAVSRKTRGEVFFPVGIGLSAMLMPSPIIFTAAILHLSLADGFAAVMGKRFGVLHQYKVRNYTKTLAGSATFYVVSTLIVTMSFVVSGTPITWPIVPILVWLPLAATLVENVAVGGTDNIFVPLLVIIVLQASGLS